MKNRSETDFGELSRVAKMPVLLGARRGSGPRRTVPYVGRSRFFMNDPG